jgi:ATP-dependent RNA helicase DeaD
LFKDLNLKPEVLKAIEEIGFDSPTEIQEKAIPIILETSQDFVGQAQTGTGKTASFVVPLLHKIDMSSSVVQALILAPTRELASQVENEIQKIGKYMGIKSTCIYGGTAYDKQIHELEKNKPQIVVGTPGRVIDMLKKGILVLDSAKFCILDEADEMLNMGFFDDVQLILNKFGQEKQLIMFSATMPGQILNIIKKSFTEPVVVKIENKTLSNEDIEQKYFVVRDKHFKEALARLVDIEPEIYAIVFCRTKLETKDVGDDLKRRGHLVEVLNGDMGQTERDHSMKRFKDGKVKILVCTDVAARGIDVNNLTHVFNYGLTRDIESYVHRIGRTGRAGMKGKAYTIVGPNHAHSIKEIEKHINKKIELSKLPSVEDLKSKMVQSEIEGTKYILNAIQEKGDSFRTEASYELFSKEFADVDKEELMKMFFVWKFNKEIRRYNNLSDIEDTADKKGTSVLASSRSTRGPGTGAGPRKGGAKKNGGPKRKNGAKNNSQGRFKRK